MHLAFLLSGSLWAVEIPLWIIASWIVFMCAVQALPRPTTDDPRWYIFLYRFGHLLSMNIALALDPKKKLPQISDDAAEEDK
jgi:ABC-type multidrug transport system permease subunit